MLHDDTYSYYAKPDFRFSILSVHALCQISIKMHCHLLSFKESKGCQKFSSTEIGTKSCTASHQTTDNRRKLQ